MTGPEGNGAGPARGRRILFSLLHAGYLRSYQGAVRALAERGHTIHLALGRLEKDEGDLRLAQALAAELPGVTYGLAAGRSRRDPWRALAWLVRAFGDLARYMHPSYAQAPALRQRVARKISNHVRTAKQVDPLTARVCLALVAAMTRISGRRPLRLALAVLGALEEAVPTSRAVDDFVREFRPDAVLVTPLIELGSTQVEYLKSARALGVRTGVCISSWDNLTGKGLIRIVPDRVFVWNDVQRREAVEMHGIPYDRIVLTGAQRFDEWFERRPATTAHAFAERVGLDPERPYLLYLCSSGFIAPREVDFVARWAESVRAAGAPELRDIGILVRPHPQNASQWRDADLSRLGNAAIWPRAGAQPDAGEARADFFDSLAHSAAVVGINTSALIESAIVGKSVFSVLDPEFAGTQTGTLHFHYLLRENGGFLRIASGLTEHVRQLEEALRGGEADREQTRAFVASFIRPHGLDRPATPILADGLEQLALLDPPPRVTTSAAVAPLRAALGTVAFAGWALYAAVTLARRLRYRLARSRLAPLGPGEAAEGTPREKPPHELRRIFVEPSPGTQATETLLEEAAGSGDPLVAGPWTGTLEEELLYWVPFLRWAREAFGIEPARVTAVTAAPAGWYEGVAARVVREEAELAGARQLPASLALELVEGYRAGRRPIRELVDRLRHVAVGPDPDVELDARLPPRFVAAVGEDGRGALAAGVEVVEVDAGADLAAQAAVAARASALFATDGPLRLLGPLLGVPTVAVVDGAALASPDADVAYRAARAAGVPFAWLDPGQLPLLAETAARLARVSASR